MATDAGQRTVAPAPTPTKTVTVKKTKVAPPKPPTVVVSKTGQLAKVAPPKPASTDLNSYLGTDTTYEQTLANLQKQLATFLGGQTLQGSQQAGDYANSKHLLANQEDTDQHNQLDEYAGRGIAHSSIYGDALGNLVSGYSQKSTDLDTQNAKFLSQLQQNKATFLDSQRAAKQKAQSDAAARRASAIAAGTSANV